MSLKEEAVVRARQLRGKYQERTEPFSVAEFQEALRAVLADLAGPGGEGLVDPIAQAVDREVTGPRTSLSVSGLEGGYKLRHGRRIAKVRARIEHAEESRSLADDD